MDALIIGAGGHGKVVLDILRAGNTHRPVGFLDADPALNGTTINGLPVLGQVNQLPKLRQKARGAVVAIGDNRTRMQYADFLRQQGFELLSAIHPSACVSKTARLGAGIVITAGAVVGTDTTLADCVIVNTSAVVDHECVIEQAAHVCPAAAIAGRVHIGAMAFIGLGCRIIQCLTIGRNAVVGAGTVVIRDVPDETTVVGVPARIIKAAHSDLCHVSG
jgi:sugar O-acyltransferase (sialic acid O-acetyltransferase NeuD family)